MKCIRSNLKTEIIEYLRIRKDNNISKSKITEIIAVTTITMVETMTVATELKREERGEEIHYK